MRRSNNQSISPPSSRKSRNLNISLPAKSRKISNYSSPTVATTMSGWIFWDWPRSSKKVSKRNGETSRKSAGKKTWTWVSPWTLLRILWGPFKSSRRNTTENLKCSKISWENSNRQKNILLTSRFCPLFLRNCYRVTSKMTSFLHILLLNIINTVWLKALKSQQCFSSESTLVILPSLSKKWPRKK